MKFSELRPVLLPEGRLIFRLYSSGSKVIDSGAVVLLNVGDALDDAQVLLVYTADCIEHVDLKITDEQFSATDWQQFFGKEVYTGEPANFPPNSFGNNQI